MLLHIRATQLKSINAKKNFDGDRDKWWAKTNYPHKSFNGGERKKE
jgi:hypothetical protein